MNTKHLLRSGLVVLPLLAVTAIVWPGRGAAQNTNQPAGPFASAVRAATDRFQDLDAATAVGYALLHGCVSGPQEGAMGIHYANGKIVADGVLDLAQPEALLYEVRNGRHQLVGVEYVVIAADWDAAHQAPPVLMGQLFNYVSSPNRYGLPPFYELHVWAWKHNPNGTFADWNPAVTCDEYESGNMMHEGHH